MKRTSFVDLGGAPKIVSAAFQSSSLSLNFSRVGRDKKKVPLPKELKQKYRVTTKKLGEGAFAEVFYGLKKSNRQPVAVKIMDKEKSNPREIEGIRNEIECLSQLNHENIVRIYDSYEDECRIVVVMEYISGDTLYDKITNSSNSFTEQDVKEILFDLASALKHCKERGVIHRDVKPKNIMYTSEEDGSILKLIDFNLGVACNPSEIEEVELDDLCGTAKYVAPEIANGDEYGYSIDIWSLGVVAYVCSSGGYLPFSSSANSSEEMSCILDKVEDGEWLFEPKHAWAGVSASLKDLISGMLSYEPENRMKYDDILNHEFIVLGDGEVNPIYIADFEKNLIASTQKFNARKKRTGLAAIGGSLMRIFKL